MDSNFARLIEALSQFKTAMLVTHDGNIGLRARPLTIADHDSDGSLWFFTSSSSSKAFEVSRDAHVAVVMQDERRFVSVSGFARLERSPERLERLWRESFRPWFPAGAKDENAVALQVKPVAAEVWDLTGTKGVAYVLQALGALVSGTRAENPSASYHVKVGGDANG
jgi:general stress protein 26